jgi:hypothetical protein
LCRDRLSEGVSQDEAIRPTVRHRRQPAYLCRQRSGEAVAPHVEQRQFGEDPELGWDGARESVAVPVDRSGIRWTKAWEAVAAIEPAARCAERVARRYRPTWVWFITGVRLKSRSIEV